MIRKPLRQQRIVSYVVVELAVVSASFFKLVEVLGLQLRRRGRTPGSGLEECCPVALIVVMDGESLRCQTERHGQQSVDYTGAATRLIH